MSLKRLQTPVILAIGLALLAGCANNEAPLGTDASQSGNPGGVQSTKAIINFTTSKSKIEDDNKFYEKLIRDYNADPNAKAEVNLTLANWGENGTEQRTWVTTQLIGNNAPDLFQSKYLWSQEDYGKGLVVDLTSDLSQPNPYNGGADWRDTLSDTVMANMLVPGTDKYAGIPTYSGTIRLFYNKDLFEKAGVSALPETWNDFLAVQDQIQKEGITPMAIGFAKQGGDRPDWMLRYLSDQTVERLIPQMDLDKNKLIGSNEIVAAIEGGLLDFTKDPWKNVFLILKDWTRYWPKGFNGITVDDANEMFLRGDAAMTLASPDFIKQLEGMNYGVMRVPYLTKENHPMAEGKYYEVASGNPDGVYVMPKTISAEKKAAALDFLMYLTSPAVQKEIAEQLYRVPVLKDAEFPDNIKPFLAVNEPFKMNLFGPAFSKNLYDTFGKDGQLYLDGSLSLDAFLGKMNEVAKQEAASLMQSQGWNEGNGYGTKK
ncbi:ABC-type glycerol-3-phosphate transport system substrate-binding protein [Paenibacillus rhizosphaerae]|uniref:ABC-type glycerol-3-phosphate transport system substrate-binding protein n=1 Tax=Paenibacillus rhizosphaerae TaxID=297318 RepID=A0A839TPG2_9BACL|nr:extracellular solute-binding protein [Paenibacillus rhizosphaerae]MBB3128655.1 ABC-type glycerol-3-phosphate transport system substrate-binding protein [Paenibacillus rhizosphaerae]